MKLESTKIECENFHLEYYDKNASFFAYLVKKITLERKSRKT